MEYKVNIQESLEAAFLEYGASVAQERSIADIRDGLKIGLRQGLYSQFYNKLTSKYKFQKAQKSVAGNEFVLCARRRIYVQIFYTCG